MNQEFYNIQFLTFEDRVKLLEMANESSFHVSVDILDMDISVRHQRTSIKFKDVMKLFKKNSHLTVAWRNYPNEYGEVCFSTRDKEPRYYLWIHLREGKFIDLIEKFNLEIEK